jgi:hypothetical protein
MGTYGMMHNFSAKPFLSAPAVSNELYGNGRGAYRNER